MDKNDISKINPSKASELLRELKGSQFIPQYNDALMKEVIDDTNILWERMKVFFGKFQEVRGDQIEYNTHVMTLNSIITRNQRCMLAYLNARIDQITDDFWKFGNTVPEEYEPLFAPHEQNFFNEYQSLIHDYTSQFSFEMDLTKDLDPFDDLFIEIRVLDEIGEIMTQEGDILKLNKDSFHFVKKSSVEIFLKQGKVEMIK